VTELEMNANCADCCQNILQLDDDCFFITLGEVTRREDGKERLFQLEQKSGQPPEEPINLLQSISIFFQLWLDLEPQTKEIPYDSRTKDLIEGLSEDPEDNPAEFMPIIELHNARLKKAHLLHAA